MKKQPFKPYFHHRNYFSMRSSKLSGYIFMNYSARTAAAGGGEQTRAAAPLAVAEGLPDTAPASAPAAPAAARGLPARSGARVGKGSHCCAGFSVSLYACDVPDSLLSRRKQRRLLLQPLSKSLPEAPGGEGPRQHTWPRPHASTRHGALRHDGMETGRSWQPQHRLQWGQAPAACPRLTRRKRTTYRPPGVSRAWNCNWNLFIDSELLFYLLLNALQQSLLLVPAGTAAESEECLRCDGELQGSLLPPSGSWATRVEAAWNLRPEPRGVTSGTWKHNTAKRIRSKYRK